MMRSCSTIAILSVAVPLISPVHVMAQVIPDQTLPNPTVITPSGIGQGQTVINGGTQRGGNLFHSFREFSIPTGGQVQFNNSLATQNIFARITGSRGSAIDGSIGANGTANLYLINPNGITFGQNAQLNLGGSFLASTARAINFADTSQFNTDLNAARSLLTTSAPVGLAFSNPGSIEVEGTGHTQLITSPNNGRGNTSNIVFTGQGQASSGLRVQPNQTLALIGGDVTFNGGLATAPSGQIEIGSVRTGNAGLIFNGSGFRVNYDQAQQFGNISLLQQSVLDATGDRFSNVHLQGDSIAVNDASLITIANTGNGTVGNIEVNASRQIQLIGLTQFNRQDLLPFYQKINRSIISLTNNGRGANIRLVSPEIDVADSAYVSTITFGSGQSGNIDIHTNLLKIHTLSPFELNKVASDLTTGTYSVGNSGTISINANHLQVYDSGIIATTSYNAGRAGDIVLNTNTASIEGGQRSIIPGFDSAGQIGAALSFIPSFIASTSTSQAASGNIFVQTRSLTLSNGAQLASTASGTGRAGDVTVNALESVALNGTVRLSRDEINTALTPTTRAFLAAYGFDPSRISIDRSTPSNLGSAAGVRNLFTSQLNNVTRIPNSEAGSVTISSPNVSITDAQISVENAGIGNAGSLTINTNRLQLDQGGSITAATLTGNGGNIFLNSDLLLLRNRSNINTNSAIFGDGGNINIGASAVALLEQSRISANADLGFGGRVNLSAIGLFRSQDSTISASSNRGQSFNGTVNINQIQTNPIETTTEVNLPIAEPKVAVACAGRSGTPASFVISGKGGQATPTDFSGQRGWIDPRARKRAPQASSIEQGQSPQSEELIEAQGAIVLPTGEVALVADPANLPLTRATVPPCQAQTP